MTMTDDLTIGFAQWHCSEEGSGPDVGMLLRLDEAGNCLWAGEHTKSALTEAAAGETFFAFDPTDDGGWWLVHYAPNGAARTVAKFASPYAGREFIEMIELLVRSSTGRPHLAEPVED